MTETFQYSPVTMPEGIAVLRPSDLGSIRIPWDARYSKNEVADIVGGDPSLSLWNPRTGGYLLGAPWRHRPEIANVLDIEGPAVSVDLLMGFIARSTELGLRLAIVAEYAERRRESFYAQGGMDVIEDIVVYELARLPREHGQDSHKLTVARVDLRDPEQFKELIELDHRAFPWLWWNTRGEFENYASVPGVAIELARSADGRTVGYIGITLIGSWGHLDRIAVDPDLQGHGYGRALLDYSIRRLRDSGARRIALSTQASNHVSRALYESVGFRRSRAHDYRIYGRQLAGSGSTLE